MNRMGHYGQDTRTVIAQIKQESESHKKDQCGALVAWNDIETGTPTTTRDLQHQITVYVFIKLILSKIRLRQA